MNPSYISNSSPNSQTQPQSAQNNVKPFVPQTHNYFPDMRSIHYKTHAFGRIEANFCEPVVPGDKVTLRNKLIVQSNPLQTPILSQIFAKKVNTFVPMHAILPNSWPFILPNPAEGDDCPSDANCAVSNFPAFLAGLISNLRTLLGTFGASNFTPNLPTYSATWQTLLLLTMTLDNMMSSGSLASNLGYKFQPVMVNAPIGYTFDDWLDDIYTYLFDCVSQFSFKPVPSEPLTISIRQFSETTRQTPLNTVTLSRRAILDLLRFDFSAFTSFTFATTKPTQPSSIQQTSLPYMPTFAYNEVSSSTDIGDIDNIDMTQVLNYGPMVAYQLSCAQFFVNTKVDFVYSAEIWRQTLQDIYLNLDDITWYEMNGARILYDECSGHYFKFVMDTLRDQTAAIPASGVTPSALNPIKYAYYFFDAIFSYNNALRFGDYFTGARTRALAVDTSGWTSAEVNSNSVSAVDVTKSIIMQRFLNAVQKVGNGIEEYVKMLSGKVAPPDYHVPTFISADTEQIQTYEIENNSNENTGDLVSRIGSSGNQKFEYSLDIDLHGYVLGLSYFYVPRAYTDTKKRWFFHSDRFDIFNEMLQNIGDQPVYMHEISSRMDGIKGYQGRNEEYKQSYSLISGAFVDDLKTWVFAADAPNEASIFGQLFPVDATTIRSFPSEFDRFLTSATGLSLAHEYHFICTFMNESDFVRPMMRQPGIL